MANTVSTISYANTFGQWMVATDALIAENNTLATGDYNKTSGTLYLNETTKNSLQANGNIIVQKQLLVQGIASSATVDNNLTVAGQVYFSNATLGLTNSGQANINGLLIAQGPDIGLIVANNTYIGGNTTIKFNTITNNIQANSTVNTTTASITGTTYTNNLAANAKITGAVSSITGYSFTNILQANSSVLTGAVTANNTVTTNILQVNSYANAAVVSVTNNILAKDIQANNSISTSTLIANTITANISATIPTLTVNTKLDGNNAAAFVNSLQVQGGGLTVNGNFVITGTTVYAANTFQLSSNASSGITSYLQVARGSSGANAAFRWNEPLKYWETLDVINSNYNRVLTDQYLKSSLTDTSTSNVATTNAANTLNSLINSTNTYLQSISSTLNLYSNSSYAQANASYASQNITAGFANAAYITANAGFAQGNLTFTYATAGYTSQNITAIFANSAFTRANNSSNTFVGTTGTVTPVAGVISFSSNNGVTIVATSANNFAISDPQDLRTSASPTFVGGTFSQTVTGVTMAAGTSNTAFATTAYVQNLANNSGTLTTNITGNAGTVTNGIYTNQVYANPSWLTSVANTKISGLIVASQLENTSVTASSQGSASSVSRFTVDSQGRLTSANSVAIAIASGAVSGLASSATTDTTNASNISSGTLGTARLPYSMDQAVATGSNVQHNSIGVGTAGSGTTGEIRATNNITAYYSDDRLKTRIGNIESALDKLLSLNGFYYQANETAQALGYAVKREVGVSAQEVQKILPEIVVPAPIDDKYLTVHYEKLLPLVIEAIKELKAEVDALKKS
jgi:hypothetical protein